MQRAPMGILSRSEPKPEAFWRTPTETLLLSLSSQRSGLAQADAKDRLARLGPNLMQLSQSQSILKKIVQRILNPLVAILIAAAAISGMSGDIGSFVIIVLVIGMSLTLDIVQEHRAELTAEALRQSVAIQADVVRDGAIVSLPVSELVPGDVVHLRTGDLVPADGIVLDVHELQVNEALMTGDPFPASKTTAPCAAPCPLKQATRSLPGAAWSAATQ
ncbi:MULTISPECIES: P-type ATPase [unclassified Bradyrhizobium]